MDNIAYDVAQHYPLPAKNVEWGEVIYNRIIIDLCKVIVLESGNSKALYDGWIRDSKKNSE